ncbi:hypothetical protein [Burkholderia glumae]|uniref:hypothetical protein n=1 Tax=Burkholderia glumae TaxID=337 RepID=UPI0021640CD7|nr:hypothetical protein [Burkholderia glumae]
MTIKTHPRESTTMPNQQPSAGSLAEIRRTLIPFYQQALYAGLRALELDQKFDVLERIDIRVEGIAEPVHSTIMGAFTQSTSSIAAVYSRLLLEFLGLKTGGSSSALVSTGKRRPGDIGVEMFCDRHGVAVPKLIRLLSRSSQIQTTWRKRGSQRAISRGNDWLTSRPIGG